MSMKDLARLSSHSASEVADQSHMSGCLVTSGHCWPSAADEEWYSLKRPSSTVAVNRSELNAKVSAFFFCTYICVGRSTTDIRLLLNTLQKCKQVFQAICACSNQGSI